MNKEAYELGVKVAYEEALIKYLPLITGTAGGLGAAALAGKSSPEGEGVRNALLAGLLGAAGGAGSGLLARWSLRRLLPKLELSLPELAAVPSRRDLGRDLGKEMDEVFSAEMRKIREV